MSAGETILIVPAANSVPETDSDITCALSVGCHCSDSSTEDVRLIPEVGFPAKLDSPGVNRESQPLLGGLDVSYNHFPGMFSFSLSAKVCDAIWNISHCFVTFDR